MTFKNIIASADIETRRAFLTGVARTTLGVTAAGMFGSRAYAAGLPLAHELPLPELPLPFGQDPQGKAALTRATARHVIFLFMNGGMSHIDTFDPKPGKATQGPIQAIGTKADFQVSQYFPLLADQMDKVCVINSMTSNQGAHEQAQYLMRTSYEKRGTIQHASLGAWHHRLAGRLNGTLPGHVMIGGGANQPSAGYFPPHYQALPIGDPDSGLQNATLPGGINEDRFLRRLKKLEQLNSSFGSQHSHRAVDAYQDAYEDAIKLMRSSDLAAFDIGIESETVRGAYGDTTFGKGCLLARRLVENGVRFVEVQSGGWDTHNENFTALEGRCPDIDQGLSALLADLDARGLLRETLVVLCTEFGRTPDIGEDNGRDHYPRAFSSLLAGGGVIGGQRFGKTDPEGRRVTDDPVTVTDFNATIAHACGIPLDHIVMSPSGRPFKVADKGTAVTSIFG